MDLTVGRNILYTSISNLLTPSFTFIFWFVTAKISGSDAIGISSTIASISLILATIVLLDTSLGMKRFMGLAISEGNLLTFKIILVSALLYCSIAVIISTTVLVIPSLKLMEAIGIDRQFEWILIAIFVATAFNTVFAEALISAKEAKKLVTPLLIGSLIRFPILIAIFLFYNSSAMGIIIAYSAFIFVSSALYFVYLVKMVRGVKLTDRMLVIRDIKKIVTAGLASWIPHVINVLGSQLAIVSVFSLQGASEAGKFYIPMAIFTFALFLVGGINRVSHPLIAGMSSKEQQTNFVSYTTRIAFIFTMPIASALLFFGGNFLGLLGKDYASANGTLAIFMTGIPFAIVTEIIYYFMYGQGQMRKLLYLGLAGNLPRVILYLLMIPFLGLNGAALAYTLGSLAQFIISIKVAKESSLAMHYRKYTILVVVPILIGAFTWIINSNYLVSTVIIFLGSLAVYIRIKLFTDYELHNILYTLLPTRFADKTYQLLSKIMRKMA